MIKTEWGILIIALLLILDLLIAATRVSLSNVRLSKLLNETDKRAKSVKKLLESSRLGAVLRLSQTFMRFGIAILSFSLLENWMGNTQPAWLFQLIGLILLTLFMLLIEFTAETTALENAERWAQQLAFFAQTLLFLFTPLVILPLLLLSPRRTSIDSLSQMTEDELKIWVDSEENIELEPEEKRMISEIIDFGETVAREIMVPRIDVIALDEAETTVSSAVQTFIDSGYSRLPFFSESIDNILGFLYAKDLLSTFESKEEDVNLRDLLREAYFIPETKKADDLLAEMQKERRHMAIVIDEYGGISGVVTLEDIVEEIIGEIQDEYDELEEKDYEKINASEYIFRGRIDLDDFADITGRNLPEGDADTLAGFLYEKLGRVPEGGEKVRENGLLLTIEQVADRRIRRVRVFDETRYKKEAKENEQDKE
ncbi:MAG: HlyC/CorC family transporter [Anaerolineae bacterium]|nr:HlyC/CorC family transporter [Anaerolineae bacterium]MBT7075281.1 HlyC/CorC family transporter [Anaerolineae bacterium]MBT7782203.1 HlyC/CorC family transporter [Anaerolineae bacterium]